MRFLTIIFLVLLAAIGDAGAQAFPSKPIRIYSTSPAGNSGDTVMRMIIPQINARLGQPVLMENRTAASGTQAGMAVKNADPDGHSLFYAASGTVVSAIFLFKNLPFDPLKDFAGITEVMNNPSLFAVSAQVPVNSMREFLAYAKARPGSIAYGSTGVGSAFHMLGESFERDTGVRMLHVPYGQGSVAVPVTDLASNRIQLYWPSLTSLMPVLSSGNVKVLAIVDKTGLKALPGVPTIYEAIPDYTLLKGFFGLYGPAQLPDAIAIRIQEEVKRALGDPKVVARLDELGIHGGGQPPAEFREMWRSAIKSTESVVKALNLEPQ